MRYCKKIVFKTPTSHRPSVILGVVTKVTQDFTEVKTSNKIHKINNRFIYSIQDTDQEFIEGD